jgi:hypothetical protein
VLNQSAYPDNLGMASILVGDSKLNNNNFRLFNPFNKVRIANTNLESSLKNSIWNQLDPAYKSAAEALERKKVQISQQNLPQEELNIDDWDQSSPVTYFREQVYQPLDMSFWSDYCQKASLALGQDTAILKSEFRLDIVQGDYYYYSTDGFMYKLPMRLIEMAGDVECRSENGQRFSEQYRYYFDDLTEVPPINELCEEISRYNQLLIGESRAPQITESYSGPVLFEGSAVSNAVRDFFISKNNGLLANRKPITQFAMNEYSGNNEYGGYSNNENRMELMMNKKIADRRLDFISMTGTPSWNGQKLFGYTPIDAQGIRPDSSLVLVENGLLRNLLSDRTPTKTNPRSNGHNLFKTGNPSSGLGAGVLRIKATATVPGNTLKDSLLSKARDEGYDYAYLYRGYPHMSGSFLYKVYPDGREELVKNGTINDLNQKQFKYIGEIGREECVYNTKIYDSKSTLIVPCGLIFKELEIVRTNDVKLNKPYMAPRPVRKNKK